MPTNSLVAPDLREAIGLPLVQPITPAFRAEPFDDPDWLFEPKYDGLRGMVYSSGLGCEIRSPRDFRFHRFGELCTRMAEVLRTREVILDGEVVALDRKGKPVFRDLIKGHGFLAFAAFDLLWLDGDDLRGLPLMERKQRLAELLPADTGPLYKILTLDEHGRALFSAVTKMDLEGMVAKHKSDPYGPGTTWYKIENQAYSQAKGRTEFRSRALAGRPS